MGAHTYLEHRGGLKPDRYQFCDIDLQRAENIWIIRVDQLEIESVTRLDKLIGQPPPSYDLQIQKTSLLAADLYSILRPTIYEIHALLICTSSCMVVSSWRLCTSFGKSH